MTFEYDGTEGDRDGSPVRKRARHASTKDLKDAIIHTLLMEQFQRRGYVVIPSCLTAHELAFLSDESTQLFAALDEDSSVATQALVENGCVLDTMADCPMEDSSPARVDKDAYLVARVHQAERLGAPTVSTIDGFTPLNQLLFERLPRLTAQLLVTDTVYFFNEHYVVKPPHTNVEFRWHRDDDEQLAMCVHRDNIPSYVSAWCALDDVTRENGPLQFVSLDALPVSSEPTIEELEAVASEPLVVTAGTVVLFLSNVWHFSASNASSTTRRAFYAQYSATQITAKPKDTVPLSFAIPCRILRRKESDA